MKKNNVKVSKDNLEEVFGLLLPEDVGGNMQLPCIEDVQKWKELNNRRIVINEPVYELFMIYTRLLIEWNKEDKDIPIEKRVPIKILLNTPGGDPNIAKTFYKMINISKTPVYIYNLGICASAGFLIFIGGHKRFMMPGSKVLIHEGYANLEGQTNQVIETIDMIKKDEKEFAEYILASTNIDKKLYNKNKKKEWWINDEDAIKLGVADGVVNSIDELYN